MATRDQLLSWYEAHLPDWNRIETLKAMAIYRGDDLAVRRLDLKLRCLERGFTRILKLLASKAA